jgi:hypothetical protein
MNEPSRIRFLGGKKEWMMWFVAMLVCIAVVLVVYVMNDDPDASGNLMLVIISGLFIGILLKSYRDISFLDRETNLATSQVDSLRQINDVGKFLEAAEPSVFRDHIKSLHTIFLSHSQISQEGILDVTHARLLASNRVVDLLASILITLGLIGTILGLLICVGPLEDVLSGGGGSADMEKIMGALRTTVKGLGTAFYTTLFGAALGGVMLRILTNVVDAHITRYIAHLAELSEVYVLPAMRRTAAQLEAQGYYKRL